MDLENMLKLIGLHQWLLLGSCIYFVYLQLENDGDFLYLLADAAAIAVWSINIYFWPHCLLKASAHWEPIPFAVPIW